MAEIPNLAMGFSNNFFSDWEEMEEVEHVFSMQSQWPEWEELGQVLELSRTRAGSLEPVNWHLTNHVRLEKKKGTKP